MTSFKSLPLKKSLILKSDFKNKFPMKKVLSIISLAIIIISCSKDDNNKGKYRHERKFKDVFCRDYTFFDTINNTTATKKISRRIFWTMLLLRHIQL